MAAAAEAGEGADLDLEALAEDEEIAFEETPGIGPEAPAGAEAPGEDVGVDLETLMAQDAAAAEAGPEREAPEEEEQSPFDLTT
ncbi:MAG: hypothetical protein GWO00_03235, partial [Gemmatimonadetes bacterium]|nr:hypothetical protein [Gemmatimonadota bacterium]NIT86013.1 hypothetical protein [Gemmatimonadota bacterium]NIU29833.1 hypothetical protein [Gemmatimonadota bacterium]NIV60242.1 hypothetical protein [Gemmatimonadota bacterium]NIW62903.1 hypothetical protein [Gemmatimonadota bacterium]